jgi:polar amino acid transport system substrate-binding protein
MDAMTLCGNKVAASKGSIQAIDYLPMLSKKCTDAGKAAIDMQQFPSASDANLALMSGRVDGVMSGSVSLNYQAKLAGFKFELAPGDPYEPKYSGTALKKGSDLRPAIEAAMKAIAASPEYKAMNEKWVFRRTQPSPRTWSPLSSAGTASARQHASMPGRSCSSQ